MVQEKINDDNTKNIDLALDLMTKKIESQDKAHGSLESKIGIFLGFVSVIASSAIVILQNNKELLGLNIFTLGLIGVYLTLIALVVSSQTKTYYEPPEVDDFYSDSALIKQHGKLKSQLISNMHAGYIKNLENQKFKSFFYNFAIYCFLLSILLLFLGII